MESINKRFIFLTPANKATQQSLIIQGSEAPVFEGDGDIDLLCSSCKSSTLVRNTRDGSFWDIVFQCFRCHQLSASPLKPAGIPFPPRSLLIPYRGFLIKGTVQQKGSLVLVGKSAYDRFLTEFPDDSIENIDKSYIFDAPFLEMLLTQAETIIGSLFFKLDEKAKRGRTCHKTPSKDPHRLMEKIEKVRQAIKSFQNLNPVIDVYSSLELFTTLSLFEEWRCNPAWSKMLSSFENPSDYCHAIVTLATATLWRKEYGSVGIDVENVSGKRNCDIRIFVSADERIKLEVKSPKCLHNLILPLTKEQAIKMLKDALKSANHKGGGQLSPESPGILVLGGFNLKKNNIDTIIDVTTGWFKGSSKSYNHIIGLQVISIGGYFENTITTSVGVMSGDHTKGFSVIEGRLAMNPNYDGILKFELHSN